jgi:hypothetical protein
MHHESPTTPWTLHPDGLGQESQKQKISLQEETDMNNVSGVVEREDTPEDPSKRTDKGKSLHAFSAENMVTLQEIADRKETVIKDNNEQIKDHHQRGLGKPIKTPKQLYEVLLTTEALLMTEIPNNEQLIG